MKAFDNKDQQEFKWQPSEEEWVVAQKEIDDFLEKRKKRQWLWLSFVGAGLLLGLFIGFSDRWSRNGETSDQDGRNNTAATIHDGIEPAHEIQIEPINTNTEDLEASIANESIKRQRSPMLSGSSTHAHHIGVDLPLNNPEVESAVDGRTSNQSSYATNNKRVDESEEKRAMDVLPELNMMYSAVSIKNDEPPVLDNDLLNDRPHSPGNHNDFLNHHRWSFHTNTALASYYTPAPGNDYIASHGIGLSLGYNAVLDQKWHFRMAVELESTFGSLGISQFHQVERASLGESYNLYIIRPVLTHRTRAIVSTGTRIRENLVLFSVIPSYLVGANSEVQLESKDVLREKAGGSIQEVEDLGLFWDRTPGLSPWQFQIGLDIERPLWRALDLRASIQYRVNGRYTTESNNNERTERDLKWHPINIGIGLNWKL